MNREILKGTMVGIIAPIAAYVVYVAFFTENADPLALYKELVLIGKLPHVLSLSVLINLLIFFMNLKTNREEQARGILFATILYAVFIIILKFFN
tara:strand:- start:153 stop:437 length:285 start_codon:yes stop_codon:yes gene_type:complete